MAVMRRALEERTRLGPDLAALHEARAIAACPIDLACHTLVRR
jgi:hypothetical protein